jgi:chromatin remodeling complex protein RSC6
MVDASRVTPPRQRFSLHSALDAGAESGSSKHLTQNQQIYMEEAKGLNRPVKLKSELAAFLGAKELPRTEITKKLWDYIKANKLQTKTENGKAENAGKFIVADAKLLPIFKNTKSKSKSGSVTDLTKLKEGETINMMQMAAVVGANVE